MKIYDLLAKYSIKDPIIGAEIGQGWVPLVEDLIQKLVAAGWDRDCHQIKEKFGGLRFHIGEANSELYKLIREYEGKSFTVCEDCGSPGELREGGWIRTLCDPCHAVVVARRAARYRQK